MASPSPSDAPPDSPAGEQAFLRGLSLVLLVLGLLLVWPFRTPIVFALVLGLILHGPHRHLMRVVRKPSISAGLLLLGVALLLLLPLGLLAFLLVREAMAVAGAFRDAGGPRAFLAQSLDSMGLPQDYAESTADRIVTRITEGIGDFLVPALNALTEVTIGLIVFFILAFFLIVDGQRVVDFVRHVMPLSPGRKQRLIHQTKERAISILYGSFIVALVQGVVAGLGWWLLGMPNPVFWGFVMLVLSIVPVMGAFFVLLPGAIYAFSQGMWVAGFGLLALNFIAVGLIDDVLRPYVIGRRSRVHPGLILLGMVGGVVVFGVGGLLIGPLVLAAIAPVLEAWRNPGEGSLDDPDAAA